MDLYASNPWKSIWYVVYAQYILGVVLILIISITTSEFLREMLIGIMNLGKLFITIYEFEFQVAHSG